MLEGLYSAQLIKKKPYFALLMGFTYSIIGIGLASWLFRRDPAIVSVALTSLLLYPTIKSLISEEINVLKKEKKSSIGLKKNIRFMIIYLFIFIGILAGFSLFSVILPPLATNKIFESQISVIYSSVGNANIFSAPLFYRLFFHNLVVLALAFLTALLIGDGAIFLLTWNASVWGTIFGNLAKTSALAGGLNPLILFLLVMAIVIPHTMMEALSYITAALSGGVFSRTLIKETKKIEKRKALLKNAAFVLITAVIILLIAVFVEQYVLITSGLYKTIVGLSVFG